MWVKGLVSPRVQQYSTLFRGGLKSEKELEETALYHALPEGKRAIGDSGYEGNPEKVTIRQTLNTDFRDFQNYITFNC